MKVLVTGGCGFVGSHIVDLLLEQGHSVLVVDDHSSGQRNHAERAQYQPLGFVERGQGVEALDPRQLEGIDAVVHAAAYPELRHNWTRFEERERLLESNILATQFILEVIPENIPVVYLSSASVYGSHPDVLVVERDASAETCESPYAATKFSGELMVAAYAHKRGTRWHALRLVNVVGARTHRGVIADFVRMARLDAGHIHAADDGQQRKSWVHVQDVAGAVATCLMGSGMGVDFKMVPSGVYNVTSRERISWWDVVDAMGVPRSEVTFEARDRGAVGDPKGLYVSGVKLDPYFRCTRSVAEGIREALASLGWTGKAAA